MKETKDEKEKIDYKELNKKVAEIVKMDKIGEIVISKVVSTNDNKQRIDIKEFCVINKMDIEPLDREFIKHRVTITEYSLKKAIDKLYLLMKWR